MNRQRETISHSRMRSMMSAIVGRDLTPADKISGGPIEHFRSGWAMCGPALRTSRAHYFRRTSFRAITAECGIEAPARHVFGAGNFPHCGHCTKRISRLRKRGWWKS